MNINAETKTGGRSHHIPINEDPSAFAQWPAGLHEELMNNKTNACVGSVLVSETDRVRVWHLTIDPGKRCPFHRHVNPYFWSCHTDGRARSYFASGEVRETAHYKGETRHFDYGSGEYMMHSVENIGDTKLKFTTVEFLDGANTPLPVPDELRLTPPE